MLKFLRGGVDANDILASRLYDQSNFYPTFLRDLSGCKDEAIIESPFITTKRFSMLMPMLRSLRARDVRVVINTRPPSEHGPTYELQAETAIQQMHNIGIVVLFTGGHHRKLAILDRAVIWEGSLNILSHSDSCEIMRKTTSRVLAEQLIGFLDIKKHIGRM